VYAYLISPKGSTCSFHLLPLRSKHYLSSAPSSQSVVKDRHWQWHVEHRGELLTKFWFYINMEWLSCLIRMWNVMNWNFDPETVRPDASLTSICPSKQRWENTLKHATSFKIQYIFTQYDAIQSMRLRKRH
jgi:hypothetical protein